MTEETFNRLQAFGTTNLALYTSRFNYNTLLDLYSNYARVVHGVNTADCPPSKVGKEYLKWEAWCKSNDKTVEQAQLDYIAIIEPLNEELIRVGAIESID